MPAILFGKIEGKLGFTPKGGIFPGRMGDWARAIDHDIAHSFKFSAAAKIEQLVIGLGEMRVDQSGEPLRKRACGIIILDLHEGCNG